MVDEQEHITLTKDELKRRFDIYNKQYFWGKLDKCRFYIIGVNNSDYGSYTPQRDSKGNLYSIIRIGRCVRWTDETLRLILVHEMIHMYVRTIEGVRIDGVLGHGRHFRKHCRRLLKDYGLKIEVHPKFEYINKKLFPKMWERVILWLIDR